MQAAEEAGGEVDWEVGFLEETAESVEAAGAVTDLQEEVAEEATKVGEEGFGVLLLDSQVGTAEEEGLVEEERVREIEVAVETGAAAVELQEVAKDW